jgi:Restriction endonuclease BamHI
MKWLRTLILFDQGNVISSNDWQTLHQSYVRSIESIDFPEGSGSLTLKRKVKDEDGQWRRNGVNYLKSRFINHILVEEKWQAEGLVDLARDRDQPPIRLYPSLELYREPVTSDFGGFDFVSTGAEGHRIAIEWETGNISSSHRSMNKLAIALANGIVDIGVLIVPSRALYEHLTDRIGNISELSGYLSMWEGLKATVERGLLAITVVEQDDLTNDDSFPYLPRGNDGRAKEGRAKKSR